MPTELYDKIKNSVSYQCEDCGAIFPSEAEALECEESHSEDEHRH